MVHLFRSVSLLVRVFHSHVVGLPLAQTLALINKMQVNNMQLKEMPEDKAKAVNSLKAHG